MGVLVQFLSDMRQWERPIRWGFLLALVLLVGVMGLAAIGRDRVQTAALIGITGLLIVMQALALYGNRHLVTAYTQAQRAFRDGNFMLARQTLERHIQAQIKAHKPVNGDVYTLLGNTLRNLGDLPGSERMLRRVTDQQPENPFALYGLGRTLLAQGEWASCSEIITKALSFGAPPVVIFDLGYAKVAAGDVAEGQQLLRASLAEITEPYRRLMACYLLGELKELSASEQAAMHDGLGYWQREASLFATPYGQLVSQQLTEIQA